MAHAELLKTPILHFFAGIIDPEGEHDVETVVKAICKKFKLKKDMSYAQLNNALLAEVKDERKRDLYVEVPVYGIIRLYKEYTLISYNGHTAEHSTCAVLEVNSREVEHRRGWDEDKMYEFRLSIEALYDVRHKSMSWPDIFELCWSMLEKGGKDQSRSSFLHACESLAKKNDDGTDYGGRISKYARWVKTKWDDYLWGKYESNADVNYCLGLREFIMRNIEAWLEGEEMHHAELRVYTDDHHLAVKEFAALRESEVDYGIKSHIFRILELWTEKKDDIKA